MQYQALIDYLTTEFGNNNVYTTEFIARVFSMVEDVRQSKRTENEKQDQYKRIYLAMRDAHNKIFHGGYAGDIGSLMSDVLRSGIDQVKDAVGDADKGITGLISLIIKLVIVFAVVYLIVTFFRR
jgi:hypothetical protein